MTTCDYPGCNEPRTKRGVTCGPEHGKNLRYALREADSVIAAPSKEKEQHEVKNDSWAISIDATRIKTLDQLLSHCQVDTQIWQVERFVANKWEVGAKGDSGKIEVEPLFQVKAWLKRKANIANALAEIESLKEEASKGAPVFRKIVRTAAPTGNVIEISIPDIHFGKLAWSGETGHSDYDTKIAIQSFSDALASLLGRTSSFQFDRIVLVIGNDVFHTDNRAGTTTRGTQVDTDSRYHKTFILVRQLLSAKIEELRQLAPVTVVVCPGNHDELSAWHLGDSLECWFANCPDVTVDNAPTPRKYLQHGKVMLMWTHGDKGKRSDYPLLMATEKPEMFGSTVFREAHTGHLHTERTYEYHGVKVRILPSLCGTDYWHASNGFTGNLKSAEAYVWNDKVGLIGTAVYTETS